MALLLYQHSRVCGDNLDHKQKEFPAYFKGIKDEDILNGNAKKNYENLTKLIFENAKAKFLLLVQFSYIYQYN